MYMSDKLPPIKRKKKIDIKKFKALAEKVRKAFEEENEYLRSKKDGNSSSSEFLIDY